MRETVLSIYKAQPVGDGEVEPCRINIYREVPKAESLEVAATLYDKEAESLEEALYNSLPGGTYDRLVSKMLLRKASHFVIPFGDHEVV